MTYAYRARDKAPTARAPRTGIVDLDLIRFHPHNVRVDLGDLRSLAASLVEFGVMQPVVLEQRGDSLRVRSGHRRVAAARQAGLDRIPAVVHPDALGNAEWLRAAVHENTRRRGMSAGDRARAVRAMRDAGLTNAEIGADLRISVRSVSRILNPESPTARRREPSRIPASRVYDVVDAQRELHSDNPAVAGVLAAIEAVLPPRPGDSQGGDG